MTVPEGPAAAVSFNEARFLYRPFYFLPIKNTLTASFSTKSWLKTRSTQMKTLDFYRMLAC